MHVEEGSVLAQDMSYAGGLEEMVSHFESAPMDLDAAFDFPALADSSSLVSKPLIFTDKTISIFDWDDTILVSTFVSNAGYRVDDTFDLPADLRASLDLLEDQVLATLQAALDRGPTLVVTNAETGWVELSGKRFLPRVLKFVEDTGIKVVSARSEYEKEFPESPSDWKAQAFLNEVGAVYRDGGDLNVMVFGDSLSERIAGHALGMRQPLARIKSIKFVERPNVEQLKRQLSLVQSSFGDLWEHDGSFDVNLVC